MRYMVPEIIYRCFLSRHSPAWVKRPAGYLKNRLYRKSFKSEIEKGREGLGNTHIEDFERVVKEVKGWLIRSIQNTPDHGSSAYYSFWGRWKGSYPETTGYLITTFLDYAESENDQDLYAYAVKMGEWLLSIQLECGAWQGLQVDDKKMSPVAFNTAMILDGLSCLARKTGDHRYLDSLEKGAAWLVRTQDSAGCWSANNFRGRKCTYNALMAANLCKANVLLKNTTVEEAARRQLDWVVAQVNDNFIDNCDVDLEGKYPLMHYIGYTLEGLLRSGLILQDNSFIEITRPVLDSLYEVVMKSKLLYGRYDSNWENKVPWICLTGTSQVSICFCLAGTYWQNDKYIDAAAKLNRLVARTVNLTSPDDGIRGGIGGSFPIDGGYQNYQYVNWAAKFFLDACLLEKKSTRREINNQ